MINKRWISCLIFLSFLFVGCVNSEFGKPTLEDEEAAHEELIIELQAMMRDAQKNKALAQFQLGKMYHFGEKGVPVDDILSYMFYTLCYSTERESPGKRGMVESRMPQWAIDEAETMAANWQREYGK